MPSFDASIDDCDDRSRPLIPDPYCLMTGGYRVPAGADASESLAALAGTIAYGFLARRHNWQQIEID